MNKNVNNNNNNNNNNANAYALEITHGDNIVYDLNGKATAPLTISNVFSALKALDRMTNKVDYTRVALMSTVLEACGSDTKLIAKTKKLLASDYGFKSTSAIDKLYRVATTFLYVDKSNILKASATDETALADTVDKDGNTFEISVDTNCIHGLKDKYGFEFSISQLQEMLWLKHDLIDNGDGTFSENPSPLYPMDKLTKLISEGKIKASMSASGKDGIRDVIKANNPVLPSDNDNDSNNDSNGNNDNDNDTMTVQYEPTSDKSKAVAIQTIINSMPDEFVKHAMVAPFVEYLTEYIKITK